MDINEEYGEQLIGTVIPKKQHWAVFIDKSTSALFTEEICFYEVWQITDGGSVYSNYVPVIVDVWGGYHSLMSLDKGPNLDIFDWFLGISKTEIADKDVFKNLAANALGKMNKEPD